MSHLLRSHAPISSDAWRVIDAEAHDRLLPSLAARRVVDFTGPVGWGYSSATLGHVTAIEPPLAGLRAAQRIVVPAVELRADFTIARSQLRDLDREAIGIDLSSLDEAASAIASGENAAVFTGWAVAGIAGMAGASSLSPLPLGDDPSAYPVVVAHAVEHLLAGGVDGPFALALSPAVYTRVLESTERGGLVIFDHLREIVGGPIVRAPGIAGAVILSMRGGDFLFESGQDLSVGFDHYDADSVHLFIEESFTFRVVTPEAAVHLTVA